MKFLAVKRNIGLIATCAFVTSFSMVARSNSDPAVAGPAYAKYPSHLISKRTTKTANSSPIIVLKQIRNTGGALLRSKSGKPLNESLTTGLFELLKERSKEDFIPVKGRAPNRAIEQRLFTLEEDISHTETDGDDGGPYLLTARLYEEDAKRHRLVAQWTGYADTFRNLTSNLRADKRVSREGLFGMLADRLKESLLALSDKRYKNDSQMKPDSNNGIDSPNSSESRPPAQLLEVGNLLRNEFNSP